MVFAGDGAGDLAFQVEVFLATQLDLAAQAVGGCGEGGSSLSGAASSALRWTLLRRRLRTYTKTISATIMPTMEAMAILR